MPDLTGLGKVMLTPGRTMITIKKRVTTQEDAGWHGQLIGLHWQAEDGVIIEMWKWRYPEVTKGLVRAQDSWGTWLEPRDEGKKGNDVPEPRITMPNKDEVRAMKLDAAKKVPKPKKAAPKKDTKKTKKTPRDLMRGRQEAKKNKKNKAAMNPKGK